MIRSFSLVVLDIQDMVIDRFNLDLVQNPSGLGFKLGLSIIETNEEDIITNVKHEKQLINMDVVVDNGYSGSNTLAGWIQRFSTTNYNMALEYYDTEVYRYCEGKVIELTKTERQYHQTLIQRLTFQPTSNFFKIKKNALIYKPLNYGKKYKYSYPYSYGGTAVSNNIIENKYIREIPITITITGAVNKPLIQLLDESGKFYTRVQFEEDLLRGEKLIINSGQKKIYKIGVDGVIEDWTPYIDPSWDTYLLAQKGKSTISVNNEEDLDEEFSLIGGWREYLL